MDVLTVNGKHGQNGRRINAQLERVDPKESDSRCAFDRRAARVPSSSTNYTTNNQTNNDTDILQERRTEELCEDNGDERQKSQSNEFG